jgi:hypothetical protein
MERVAGELKCRMALISMPRRYGAGARSAVRDTTVAAYGTLKKK